MKKRVESRAKQTSSDTISTIDFSKIVALCNESDCETLRENKQKTIEKYREAIISAFGFLSDDDIYWVIRTMQKNSVCEGCTGLPCKKSDDQGLQYVPDNSEPQYGLVIRYQRCDKYKAANQQRRLERALRSSRIPACYLGKTFADYQVDANNFNAVTFAKKAVETRQSAFFYGVRGTGKTFLASLIAQDYLNAGLSVIFIKVPMLLDDLRDTYNGKSEYSEEDLLKEV